MQNGGERKQEDINSQLPSTPKENEEESAISTKCNLDQQDQGSVQDQSDASNGQDMVGVQNEISGNLQSGDPAIPNVGWEEAGAEYPQY